MTTAIVVIVVVLAVIVGGIIRLRQTTKTGMPSQEVLDRATRRARELEAEERREEEGR